MPAETMPMRKQRRFDAQALFTKRLRLIGASGEKGVKGVFPWEEEVMGVL